VVAMRNTVDLVVEPVLLSKAINHTADLLKTRISEKNARIINNVPADLRVNYNPGYLNSVLLNFISNAIKYSHPDRQPIITLNCDKEHPGKENSGYILTIADNGLGIDLKTYGDKLFGMYKTFHGNKDAKGLGLFMTRYQVEAMDGRIEVDSTVNEGTTFKIYIR
jgi:signal transduction histidine kinase